jgi:hypothetical protein
MSRVRVFFRNENWCGQFLLLNKLNLARKFIKNCAELPKVSKNY